MGLIQELKSLSRLSPECILEDHIAGVLDGTDPFREPEKNFITTKIDEILYKHFCYDNGKAKVPDSFMNLLKRLIATPPEELQKYRDLLFQQPLLGAFTSLSLVARSIQYQIMNELFIFHYDEETNTQKRNDAYSGLVKRFPGLYVSDTLDDLAKTAIDSTTFFYNPSRIDDQYSAILSDMSEKSIPINPNLLY